MAEGGCQIDSDESDNSENGYFTFIYLFYSYSIYLLFLNIHRFSAEDHEEANWVFPSEDDDSKDSTIGPIKGKQAMVIVFVVFGFNL